MQPETDVQSAIYEVDLPLTERELRAMCESLAMAITDNRRVVEILRHIETETAQRSIAPLQAQIDSLIAIRARCAALLAVYPDGREGWRLAASRSP